jgi:hypothetical protein
MPASLRRLVGLAGRDHMGAGAGPFHQPPGEERDAGEPEHEIGDAEGVAARQPGEAGRPAPDEGDALCDHEGAALGDRRRAQRHDQRGDAQHGDAVAVEAAEQRADRQRRQDRDQRRILQLHQPAADDGGKARHLRDREVELGDGEGEREAERQDGEEARVLQHVDDVHRRGEVRREGDEEDDQGKAGERGAIAADDLAHRQAFPLAIAEIGERISMPPVTGISAPVTKAATGESRKAITPATSSGRPRRPSGVRCEAPSTNALN